MEEFMFWLVGNLRGIDGLTILILAVAFFALHLAIKADAPRRDSKRRNQARRVR
jgi:hypothetical protein